MKKKKIEMGFGVQIKKITKKSILGSDMDDYEIENVYKKKRRKK